MSIGKYCFLIGGVILGMARCCLGGTETIDYSVAGPYVYGSFPGSSSPNIVTDYHLVVATPNGEVTGDVYAASVGGGTATVQGNTLVMKDGGYATGTAYGGYGCGSVGGNSVTIEGGATAKVYANYVYGGRSAGAMASVDGNSVEIRGVNTTIGASVCGGRSDNGDASQNHVGIYDATVSRQVFGGLGEAGTGNGNTVEISNAKIGVDVSGGIGASGASGNSLTITGDDTRIGEGFTGGRALYSGEAIDNRVEIDGGVIDGDGGAGVSLNGIANKNTLIIRGGTAHDSLVAGNGKSEANDNLVQISGTSSVWFLVGGAAEAETENNRIEMTGGLVETDMIAGIGGVSVSNNSIAMDAGRVGGNVYGGRGEEGALVSGNSVSISDGNVGAAVYGGYAGYNDTAGDARDNVVSVVGGTIGEGYAGDGVYGGYSFSGAASGNTAIIDAGEVDGDVYGGRGAGGGDSGNSVYLRGGRISGGVYGGNATKSGNTLYLHGYFGSVAEINSFENYSIILSDDVVANDPASSQITITGSTPTDLTGAKVIDFSFAPGSRLYYAGDEMIIIDSTTDTDSVDRTFNGVPKGPTAVYDVQVLETDAKLVARILGRDPSPYSAHFNENRLASLEGLAQAGDLVSGAGLDRAWSAVSDCQTGNAGTVFATANLASDKLDDRVRMRSWSFLTGIGWRDRRGCEYGFLGAAFVEAGTSDFWGEESYEDYGTIRYDGDSRRYGAGVLARYRFESGFRIDGSARFGREKCKYEGKQFLAFETPRYDLASNYVGLHGGVGYDVELGRNWSLDLSAVYQWVRLGSGSARILGEDVRFSAVHSHRVKAGPRLAYRAGSIFRPFVGVFYEYEFGSSASSHNSTIDMRNGDANIRGGTGTGELGVAITPTLSRDMLIEASVRGHVGKREGVSCQVSFGWVF